jgi:hypothetical protein
MGLPSTPGIIDAQKPSEKSSKIERFWRGLWSSELVLSCFGPEGGGKRGETGRDRAKRGEAWRNLAKRGETWRNVAKRGEQGEGISLFS